MLNGTKVSKWFIYKNPNLANGYIDENIKVNKLLYFSQLMYYSVFNKKLLSDKFIAFPKGPVIFEVYTDYRYNGLNRFVNNQEDIDDKPQKQILEIVNFMYAKKNTEDLIKVSHNHNLWNDIQHLIPYNPEIIFENVSEDIINYYKNIYSTYKDTDFSLLGIEHVGGNTYYYRKDKITLNEDVISKLYEMPKFEYPQFVVDIRDDEIILA